MKTKKVRPVILNTNNDSHIYLNTLINKLGYVSGEYPDDLKQFPQKVIQTQNQKLILISLDPDEKIEVGDIVCNTSHLNEGIIAVVDFEDVIFFKKRKQYKKVIATQSQLSTEYITQFITEYNNGDVKDIEIEIDCFKQIVDCIDRKTPNGTEYKDIGYDLICKPKLTNGFITIIYSTIIDNNNTYTINFENAEGINHLEWIYNRLINIHKENPNYDYMIKLKSISEQITYTEEEVRELLHKYEKDMNYYGRDGYYDYCFPKVTDKWLNENKKK